MLDQRDEWTLDLAHIVGRIRRRWRVVVAVGLLGLAAGGGLGVVAPDSYSATASAALSPIRLPGTTNVQSINIDTEQAVLLSREVATAAAKSLGKGVAADQLLDASTVAAPEGSEVLQLSITTATPADAARWADGMMNAYLRFRSQTALQAAQPAIDALNQQVAATPAADASALADLKAQRTALQHIGDSTGRIIGHAVTPISPSSPGLLPFLVGGLAAGLLVGLVLALLRDHLDPRVRFGGRFFELTGRDGVVVDATGEQEAMRWVLRALLAAPTWSREGVVVAALLGDDDRLIAPLLTRLHAIAARVARRNVRIIGANELSPALFEREWRFEPLAGDEIVLIDAHHITSPAQLAVLIAAVDAAVVVAGRRSRVRATQSLLTLLSGAEREAVVPVFVKAFAPRKAVARQSVAPVAASRFVGAGAR